jgi:hypothetical protein
MALWDERKRAIWKAISRHEDEKGRHAMTRRSYRDVVINEENEITMPIEEYDRTLHHTTPQKI